MVGEIFFDMVTKKKKKKKKKKKEKKKVRFFSFKTSFPDRI
jgi:hypothetical protein